MRFRQSLLSYAEEHGVTKAAIKYNVNRQYIYRWKRRDNGDIQSLETILIIVCKPPERCKIEASGWRKRYVPKESKPGRKRP